MYVDGSDIPALQQKTCQTLRSVTMARQFWYDRIHRLCKEQVVYPPEEELEEYSIAELEQWTMRRIRARSTSPVKIQLRSQDLPMPLFFGKTFLSPGGRWLIKPHYDLRVYFVDLDSSNLELHLLLDPKKDDPRISSNHQGLGFGTRIWIDHKAPRLSFRFQGCIADT
ncbi:hypothetical protein AGABI2DRAFT_179169, partial [Agaricus bisporus var. bisporus H97]|uniref:hypothetical protein n=1 Tax=Agaricus bisporus var. bisporus (strain H97 / ATCC MYA-4626 / FGSC 10389) TaxID=936046 RepID=UPI00029F4F4A